MRITETGFYVLDSYVYYGTYPKNHISGKIKLSIINPELFKTNMPFSPEDFAIKLYDNHALTEQEFNDMEQALRKLSISLSCHTSIAPDYSVIEEKLGISFPQELKILYAFLSSIENLTSGSERFLPLDELYLDHNNLVFYKIKRTPVALSLTDGLLMRYYKKEWNYSLSDENFLCFTLDRIVVKAISQMPIIKKGKIKGELRRVLSPQKPLQEIFQGKLDILEEYRNYGNIILNNHGALCWFRQNGFYADILIGCTNQDNLDELMATDLPVVWE